MSLNKEVHMAWEYRIQRLGNGDFTTVEISTNADGTATVWPSLIRKDSREAVLNELARMLKECTENPVIRG